MPKSARLLLIGLVVSACATPPKPALPARVRFAIKGVAGRETLTKNISVSRTRAFEDGQLVRDGTEAVEFTARTRVTAVDGQGRVTTEVTTLAKDGKVPLDELAYPEVGESIEYVTAPDGTVLRAGPHSPLSLYFIPSLPLPTGGHEVEVGDTWDLDHEWRSAQGGLPLRLEVTGILKGLMTCADGAPCADVEISGRVNLLARPDRAGARFENRVRGRAVFSIDRGEVRFSEMRAREEFVAGPRQSIIDSCMVSNAVTDAAAPKPRCEPGDEVAITPPGGI